MLFTGESKELSVLLYGRMWLDQLLFESLSDSDKQDFVINLVTQYLNLVEVKNQLL